MTIERYTLAYGRGGLEISLSYHADVVETRFQPGLPDEVAAIRSALQHPIGAQPLAALAGPGSKVTIAHSDITRPTPNRLILPVVLRELEQAGVRREDIILVCALGTHKPHSPVEMEALLGAEILNDYRCIQHTPLDPDSMVSLGMSSFGHPVQLNRALFESDLNVLTGFIEPHFFAGFSGGPKGILPGLASEETVIANHGLEMIGHPNATFGITNGNPLWEEMLEASLKVPNTFLLNVALNRDRQITGIFAGDLVEAHRQGCEFVHESAMAKVERPYDVVITTNSGYPLDQNLYQCAKGMSAAAQIVRPGGAILMAAECEDGLPDDGAYVALLDEAKTLRGLQEMMAKPDFHYPDQWQVQVQAMILEKADVYVYSGCLTAEKIRRALFLPCENLPAMLEDLPAKYGSRVCILPEGPQVIAYL